MGQSKRVEFAGAVGEPLAARLELPDSPPRAYALFAHCFACGKDEVAAARIARAMTEFGFAVLRFDLTGLGGSGGDFADTDFSSTVEDLVLAAGYLRDRFTAPALLIGHSFGGAAVLAATRHIPETRAVATIGAPADLGQVATPHRGDREEAEDDGRVQVRIAGRPFRMRRDFLDDLDAQPQAERIAALGAALLVVHSPVDEQVGIDHARRVFDAARHPKSFVAVDGADHLLTRLADADFVATVVAAWARRYTFEPTSESTSARPAEGSVEVTDSGAGSLAQRIAVGRHVLAADEPEPAGADTGPSPYDLLLAALGTCTSMTVRMYAARKKWKLDNVRVSLRHTRVHATDCADCETRDGKVDHIDRMIRLDGDLDADQRQRLLEIADRCPVHRTLRSPTIIETTTDSSTAAEQGD